MRTTIATLVLILLFASQSSAEICPAFFRFVDFGLQGTDGTIYRGGPTLRAEGLNGQPLLLRERTTCLNVREIAKDGHGNPIPVVTSINYDPETTDIGLNELRVVSVDDTGHVAEQNAHLHRIRVSAADTELTRGPNFLCARPAGSQTLSCQLESPYPGNIALVIYCDAVACRMPIMAISDKLHVSAVWPTDAAFLENPNAAGADMSDKVRKIRDFLVPLSASL